MATLDQKLRYVLGQMRDIQVMHQKELLKPEEAHTDFNTAIGCVEDTIHYLKPDEKV